MNTTDFANSSATETVSKPELTQVEQFAWALQRLATMQGGSIDVLSLNASASVFEQAIPAMQKLALMCQRMGLEAPKLVKHPDQVHMPMLAHMKHMLSERRICNTCSQRGSMRPVELPCKDDCCWASSCSSSSIRSSLLSTCTEARHSMTKHLTYSMSCHTPRLD
jgi:hypothetical protein